MSTRIWPMAAALALFAAAWVRLLAVTDGSGGVAGGALAGLLIAVVVTVPLTGAVWAAAGGDVVGVLVGAGPRVWFRQFASGRTVSVHALPFTAIVAGYGARPGRNPRTPPVAAVAFGAALAAAGAGVILTVESGFGFGLGAGAFLLSVAQFASRKPAAYLPAARSETEARRRARVGPVALAGQRRDHADVLRRTAELPAVPGHWTDSLLIVVRAASISVTASSGQAAQLLRTALTGPEDALTPVVRAALTTTLFDALLRGEVPPEHRAAVADEIRARVTHPGTRTGLPVAGDALAAIGAYLNGNWPVAAARSVAAARAASPGSAGDQWALASLACTASGDTASAARHLETAVRDDPAAVLVPVARAALTPTRA